MFIECGCQLIIYPNEFLLVDVRRLGLNTNISFSGPQAFGGRKDLLLAD